jgi:hypothetical protein
MPKKKPVDLPKPKTSNCSPTFQGMILFTTDQKQPMNAANVEDKLSESGYPATDEHPLVHITTVRSFICTIYIHCIDNEITQ